MATYDELFGKKDYAEKRAAAPKWLNVGDSFTGVITSDIAEEQQLEVNASWNPMFLEKQTDGKWKPKHSGDLTEGLDKIALTQFVLSVQLMDGTPASFYFDNKAKKEALKVGMQAFGGEVGPGVGVRMTRTEGVGRSYGWSVDFAKGE
jgi:hypothetical protein